MGGQRITVEVAYAEPDRQFLERLEVAAGTTVGQALSLCGVKRQFPDLSLADAELGVWGHPAARDRVLIEGDRVEIYRPLAMDPREARRRLAAHGAAMGSHGERDEGESGKG